MSRKKILGSHMKRLLSGVSDHGGKHLSEVEMDLVQTGRLLEEAVGRLTQSFMAIHQVVDAQQHSVNRLLAGSPLTADEAARLGDMAGEIGEHVSAAITSMQFQDMTSQLIDRTLKRVTGLRAFLGTLGTHSAGVNAETGSEEIVDLLGKVSMVLAIQSLELRSVLRKAVNQQHLESGDIELF